MTSSSSGSFSVPDEDARSSCGQPILVLGQSGRIDFTIGDRHIDLEPGPPYVEAKVTHSLHATTDAVATLMVLESSGS